MRPLFLCLRPLFERGVHRFKTTLRIAQSATHQSNQDAGEPLAMHESNTGGSIGFQQEVVLAVEHTGYDKAAYPPQFPLRQDGNHRGAETHSRLSRRPNVDTKPRSGLQLSGNGADERVTAGHRRKVRKHLPDSRR